MSTNDRVLMFHNLPEKVDIEIEKDDVLTFDDGHYSVLRNVDLVKDLPNRKIVFIVPNFVSLDTRKEEPDCSEYWMDDFFLNGRRDQFLNLFEIEKLISLGFEVGMHSYYHDVVFVPGKHEFKEKNRRWYLHKISYGSSEFDDAMLKILTHKSALSVAGVDRMSDGLLRGRTAAEFEEYVKRDTELCVQWFKRFLFPVKSYAYPFFQTSDILEKTLDYYGITERFGERIYVT